MSSSFIPNEADILSINSVSLQPFLDPDMEAFCCNPLDAGKQVGQIMIFFSHLDLMQLKQQEGRKVVVAKGSKPGLLLTQQLKHLVTSILALGQMQ